MERISDAELRALTFEERAELLRRLSALHLPPLDNPAAEHRRHRFTVASTAATVILVPWIVLLGLTLPHHYLAARWDATWLGFDAVLIVCLAATAWLASRRRQALVVALVVTGTLLVCDAWFDVMTARGSSDLATSLASAAFVELPSAILLFALARRLLRITVHVARARAGELGPDIPFHRMPLLGVRPPAPR